MHDWDARDELAVNCFFELVLLLLGETCSELRHEERACSLATKDEKGVIPQEMLLGRVGET